MQTKICFFWLLLQETILSWLNQQVSTSGNNVITNYHNDFVYSTSHFFEATRYLTFPVSFKYSSAHYWNEHKKLSHISAPHNYKKLNMCCTVCQWENFIKDSKRILRWLKTGISVPLNYESIYLFPHLRNIKKLYWKFHSTIHSLYLRPAKCMHFVWGAIKSP